MNFESSKPLKEQFHYGFMLQGNGKVFGAIGIALAMYSTTPKANRKKFALLVPYINCGSCWYY